jgi:hypothetical protein
MKTFIILLLLALLLYLLFRYWQLHQLHKKRTSELTGDLAKTTFELTQTQEQLAQAGTEVEQLAPYRELRDADTYAASTIERAEAYLRGCTESGNQAKESAETEVSTLLKNAREKAQSLKDDTALALSNANSEYQVIVDKANETAKQIAGDAYYAMENKTQLEESAKAMKNVIAGYGNQYLIPSETWIDDLAEEYSYKEAGQKLKTARLRVRQMVSDKLASMCDYAERRRKEIAESFVIDAFNGKVDTIMTKVKRDNFGTLSQKLKDAFSLVNHDGAAFRNARITQPYLDARLDELQWACATKELQDLEREEQREIKVAVREEERARREYEKALKQTEKEEKMLREAMEKARKQLQEAHAEDASIYQDQLDELQGKLEEAEAKNQRALSMAQQTKRGHVYIISNIGSFGEEVFKIGLTRRLEPLDRVKELGDASVPFLFDVHAMIYSEDAPQLESSLHKVFEAGRVNKVNHRKEFFRVGISEIKEHINSLGIEAKWTMAAEAQQFRESVALAEITASEQK